jgi:hypothetical protein
VKPRARFELVVLVLNLGALAGVLLALALGATPARMWAMAEFLFVGSAAAIYAESAIHLTRRRARAQSGAEVPLGVRLRKPVWMSAGDPLSIMGVAALLGAAAAGAGYASVGVGILLAFVVILFVASFAERVASPRSITFEPDGLRVYIRGGSFVVPWKSITSVEVSHVVHIRVRATAAVVETAEPDTPRMRARARLALFDGDQPGGKLTLSSWTAGLDGSVLARAIRAGADRRSGPVN